MVKRHTKSPSYLLWTPHGYYFRLRVPADLRPLLGVKTELRYALRTGNQSEAKQKARLLAGRIQRLFKQLRRKGYFMSSELNELQVQQIIKGYVKEILKEDEIDRVIESVRQRGEVRIFPELKRTSYQFSHAASKWFNGRYKKQIGLTTKDGQKKTYHSFRHTLTDHLKQKLIPGSVIDEFTGHAVQGESLGRYGKAYLAEVLYESAVLKLEYGLSTCPT